MSLYLDFLSWCYNSVVNVFNCCKRVELSSENKAREMLNDWIVDTYANNIFLHKTLV